MDEKTILLRFLYVKLYALVIANRLGCVMVSEQSSWVRCPIRSHHRLQDCYFLLLL